MGISALRVGFVPLAATTGKGGQMAGSNEPPSNEPEARRILWISTAGFTLLFAVWLMFGVLALPIRKELSLTEGQFSWLTAIAILNGSAWRLMFGILADRWGGKRVMTGLLLVSAVPTLLVSFAHSFGALLGLAFLVGVAGNGFSAGVAWNSVWCPRSRQGFALGVFGAGNVGASVTKLIGPAMIALVPAAGWLGGVVPGGWRFIPALYAVLLVVMAILTWMLTPADRFPGKGRAIGELFKPLAKVRVWRFGLYYVVMFGAYVALSVWLPRYYQDVYHLTLGAAAGLTALFIFPASLLRPLGGYLSDRIGARTVMYSVLAVMTLAAGFLAVPACTLTLGGRAFHPGLGVGWFTLWICIFGAGMGIGKAAVYKYIPEYFPRDVGAVGGLVGALGGLGGFFLPPLFACCEQWSGFPQMTFGVVLALVVVSFLWLHATVLGLRRTAAPAGFEAAGGNLSDREEHAGAGSLTERCCEVTS